MPKLIIDNQELEVPTGTKVIDAAEKIGIMIPRFCYHPALGSVGACRVCAVKFLQGPIKGVQMSCMIDAADDMVVSTTDEEAVDFRRHVIEWLMLHHPHDCPVCDEGGHCLLQDMTVSGGHGIRRYPGKKRTHHDQHLGPLVQHEMNRCIQCYRCSRYYQEFCGYRDLGVMGIGHRVYFGRKSDGTLESPFAGNLTDICPTGVYTDKPSRFFGRRWDYERSPSLCLNCSLGCHTVVSARYRTIVRQEARHSPAVNGYFICDRGRYGFSYASLPDRPRRAAIEGKPVSVQEALNQAVKRISDISMHSGASAVACAGSSRSNLETLAALDRLSRKMGWQTPVYWMEKSIADRVKSAATGLETDSAVSLQEVSQADMILVVGTDPINEAPMLALALRQAQRRGARVVVLDPRPVSLPFEFQHLPLNLEEIDLCLGVLIKKTVERGTAEKRGPEALAFLDAIQEIPLSGIDQIDAIASDVKSSRRPLIVCGTDAVTNITPVLAADAILLLQSDSRKAGLFYVLPGPNAFGAALIDHSAGAFDTVVSGIEKGNIKALVLVECDPVRNFPDRGRLERALAALDLLVVLDYLDNDSVQQAHIFLPTTTLYESGGLFINQEGRMQAAPSAYSGGYPIAETGGGDHPPRDYGAGLPGADPAEAGQLLAAIVRFEEPAAETITRSTLQTWLAETLSLGEEFMPNMTLPDDGIRLQAAVGTARRFSLDWSAVVDRSRPGEKFLQLLTVERTFGTEELSSLSPHLDTFAPEARLFIHKVDAEHLGLEDGDMVAVTTECGSVKVKACIEENMRAGVLILPRLKGLDWQQLGAAPVYIAPEQIRKF